MTYHSRLDLQSSSHNRDGYLATLGRLLAEFGVIESSTIHDNTYGTTIADPDATRIHVIRGCELWFRISDLPNLSSYSDQSGVRSCPLI